MVKSKKPTREKFLELCKECESADELAKKLDIALGTLYRKARLHIF